MDSLKNLSRLSLISYVEDDLVSNKGQIDLLKKFFSATRDEKPSDEIRRILEQLSVVALSEKKLSSDGQLSVGKNREIDFVGLPLGVVGGNSSLQETPTQTKNSSTEQSYITVFQKTIEDQKKLEEQLTAFFDQSFSAMPSFWADVSAFFRSKEKLENRKNQFRKIFEGGIVDQIDVFFSTLNQKKNLRSLYKKSSKTKDRSISLFSFEKNLERQFFELNALNRLVDECSLRAKMNFNSYVFSKKNIHVEKETRKAETKNENIAKKILSYSGLEQKNPEDVSRWVEFLFLSQQSQWPHQECLADFFNQFSEEKLFYFLSQPVEIFLDPTPFHCTCSNRLPKEN